jgi:hypothetical protein
VFRSIADGIPIDGSQGAMGRDWRQALTVLPAAFRLLLPFRVSRCALRGLTTIFADNHSAGIGNPALLAGA